MQRKFTLDSNCPRQFYLSILNRMPPRECVMLSIKFFLDSPSTQDDITKDQFIAQLSKIFVSMQPTILTITNWDEAAKIIKYAVNPDEERKNLRAMIEKIHSLPVRKLNFNLRGLSDNVLRMLFGSGELAQYYMQKLPQEDTRLVPFSLFSQFRIPPLNEGEGSAPTMPLPVVRKRPVEVNFEATSEKNNLPIKKPRTDKVPEDFFATPDVIPFTPVASKPKL